MADPTPLLTQYSSTEPEKNLISLDSSIEHCVGNKFGLAQFLQAILVSLTWIFDAQQTFISIFTDAEPSWHCTQNGTNNTCSMSKSLCELPANSWAWDMPAHASIVSEWGLTCAGSFFTGLPASSYFMGCLIGGVALATLADSFGRKKVLFFTTFMMGVFSFLTKFSTNVYMYSALRFLTGFFRATIGTSALVLSTEIVIRKWRGQIGIINFLCFTSGFLSLPIMGYLMRGSSWRNMYLWTSLPTILYSFLVRYLVPESPRWLIVKGRKEEAMAALRRIAPESLSSSSLSFVCDVSFDQETGNSDVFAAIKILVRKTWAFKRLCVVMIVGVGVGMLYYGMPLALGNLAMNLYLNVALNALTEVPSNLIALFVLERSGRKISLLIFTILSGVCSVMCVVIGQLWTNSQVVFELVSFFSACTSFSVLLIYTIELFPTCVRNSAVSMVRQALVLGGVFSPMLAAAGRGNEFFSYGVYGLVVLCCGLWVVFLPETVGKKLCDTMEEEEHREKSSTILK